ncbi:MAG: gamma-glutamyl-gamma-aminobutyrate hydrolase family protein [Chitinophagaceae bacterium]|nr:gamma-glutamyl-gamma-aminobutyrate hydrolase family protein [Chitinophagaceae bacterium]
MKIGLSYPGDEKRYNQYATWLQYRKDIQVIRLAADEQGNGTVEDCKGLIISGGVDVHPQFYNGNLVYEGMPATGFDTRRDEFELSLLHSAVKRRIPVLGICRGLQLINVFFGGTLQQHIHEKDVHHRGDPDKYHTVDVDDRSLLYEIAGCRSITVNSAHHQCVNQLGAGLAENCRSGDGIIEGIEQKRKNDYPFMVGVQWHPERVTRETKADYVLSEKIRDRFINDVLKSVKNI